MEERFEKLLVDPPTDMVPCIRFAPSTDRLAVCSWDQSIRVYTVQSSSNGLTHNFQHGSPVFDVCWAGDCELYSGGLDGVVKGYQLESCQDKALGQHADAVSALCVQPSCQSLFSGSWDKTIKQWDNRSLTVNTIELPAEVLAMDCCGPRLTVALACQYIFVYDVRNMKKPEQRRESALAHQIRCLRCFPNGEGFGISSVEGRIAMEWFDTDPEMQRLKKYAFKSPRQPCDEVVYPVNAIAFYPRYTTFATGGGDDLVHIWNGATRKRLYQLRRFPTSISSLSFNSSGSLLAIAASHGWDNVVMMNARNDGLGQQSEKRPPDQIYIRPITDSDMQSKS